MTQMHTALRIVFYVAVVLGMLLSGLIAHGALGASGDANRDAGRPAASAGDSTATQIVPGYCTICREDKNVAPFRSSTSELLSTEPRADGGLSGTSGMQDKATGSSRGARGE